MKNRNRPKYHFKYNFPNEKFKKRYCNEYFESDKPFWEIEKKYEKYREVENWDDFEEGFFARITYVNRDPSFNYTHIMVYRDFYITAYEGDTDTDFTEHLELIKFYFSIDRIDYSKLKFIKIKRKCNYIYELVI